MADERRFGERTEVSVFYRFLTTLLYPVAWVLQAFSGRDTHFSERMGYYAEPMESPQADRFRVWLHGASAGEVTAIQPLVCALRETLPTLHLTITTTSLTGRKMAIEKKLAERVALAPLDLSASLARAFESFRPQLILIAETEFWPLWMAEAKRRGIPVVLVNGRISDKSYPSYRWARLLFKNALATFSACLVQTHLDQERLVSLGALEDRVEVMGQMKYDLGVPDPRKVEMFAAELGITSDDMLFTFGSLREGEDQEFLTVLPELLRLLPTAKVVLAPRHFRNLGLFERVLHEQGVPWTFRSRKSVGPWRVLVLDTMGELGLAYSLSRAAFVGGTLVPVGGHNVMEPVLSGVPVCFGPYQANVREAASVLLASGGAAQVSSAHQAVEWMVGLQDRNVSREAGHQVQTAVEPLRGATRRTLQRLKTFLPVEGRHGAEPT
jgi:3-deoxy-D-manno-octulosonic-acid transferase